MLLGVHCSIAGGVINAFNQAEELNIDTFQIFTKNQRQWKEKAVDVKEGSEFRNRLSLSGVKIGFSHSTYLINLATSDEQMLKNSILTLAGEVCRCDALNLSYTVLHPGTAKNCAEEEAIR